MFAVISHSVGSRKNRDRFLALGVLLAGAQAIAAPLDPPTPEALTEAKRIVQELRENQRGPYSRIRWFCNDGTVQPPVAYACAERGGGRQHAEYSPARQRLADLGWPVGTIFTPMDFAELFDDANRQQRLRQVPLENYLVDIDDGWVLHRANTYRGRVQIEDEEVFGKRLLTELLADAAWASENFLLVREAARSIPHGDNNDLARMVRRKAIQLAELESAAERWRAEIHSAPSAATAGKIRRWASQQKRDEVSALASTLANELDELYGPAGRRTRIGTVLNRIGKNAEGESFRRAIDIALKEPPLTSITAVCTTMARARSSILAELPPELRLALIDALRELDSEVQLAYLELKKGAPLSRADTLLLSSSLLDCGYASGFLSAGERAAASVKLDLGAKQKINLDDYRSVVARLKRVPGWAIGTVRHTFAEALMRYTALDFRAARFSDDLLRGSPLWILGDLLKTLSKDRDRLSGSVVEIDGNPVGAAVALNPGIARGTLRIFETIEALEGASLNRSDIAVIPETIAELSPVAGILTLGEGNALSHVQLLARNFGIPNVAIDYDVIKMLEPLAGTRVLMIVSSEGDVLLKPDEAADETPSGPLAQGITVPVPNLRMQNLLTLNKIGRQLSGKVVGPKAANLGELNRLFPCRVAPAVAIPFGIYAAHLDAAGLTPRIRAAFAGVADGTLNESAFNAELASVRRDIAALKLSADLRDKLEKTMREQFGEAGTYGIFVRSDTNVEDLPQFTGAGLNETLPNIVDPDEQITAIPRVWSSVLSPRALAWRSSVLANPDQIYASVLLMKSVPSTKSGVLVTTNLYDRNAPGITASTAWGVGGAVAGEAAETIAMMPTGIEVMSEAKSPYQRHVSPAGGVDWVSAPAGRVLTRDEMEQLKKLAIEVNDKYKPVFDDNGKARPWDIEFGFVEGELTLFQIRPLVERGSGSADQLLRRMRPGRAKPVPADTSVAIDQPPGV